MKVIAGEKANRQDLHRDGVVSHHPYGARCAMVVKLCALTDQHLPFDSGYDFSLHMLEEKKGGQK